MDSATSTLRNDHKQIHRLQDIIVQCYTKLYDNYDVPLSDIDKIIYVISEFLDSIHYSREEDSYFACVASYGTLKEEIRVLLIEHEFSRRIATSLQKHLNQWREGTDAREPVARYLRTYSIYLQDHLSKEDKFFDQAEEMVLSKEEEIEMYEQFKSVMAVSKKLELIIREIEYLESRPWYTKYTR